MVDVNILKYDQDVAQLVEHMLWVHKVSSSSLGVLILPIPNFDKPEVTKGQASLDAVKRSVNL